MDEANSNGHSFITQVKRTKDRLWAIYALLGGLILLGFHIANFVNSIANKTDIDGVRNFCISENQKLVLEIDSLKSRNQTNADKQQDTRKMLAMVLESYAAEMVYKKSTRAKANQNVARAHSKFKKAINEGKTLEQAYEESQESLNYWPFGKNDE